MRLSPSARRFAFRPGSLLPRGKSEAVPEPPADEHPPDPTPEPEQPAPEPAPPAPDPQPPTPEPTPPAPQLASVPPLELVPEAPSARPVEPAVVRLPLDAEPHEWNVWELERMARGVEGRDPARDEELAFLLLELRQFANPDGQLPVSFDPVIRESFGELLYSAA